MTQMPKWQRLTWWMVPLLGALPIWLLSIHLSHAETVEYTQSGGATAAEIAHMAHLNWERGQSLAAVESSSGLGPPNRYWEPPDRPGFVQAEYDIQGLNPVDPAGVIPAHGTVTVDYTYEAGRGWVATTPPAVWTAGANGFQN